jgi:phosphoglycerate dehydrogenase-like enzyme
MPIELPETLNVLLLVPLTDADIERVRAVAPSRLNVVPAWDESRPLSRGAANHDAAARPSGDGLSPEEFEEMVRTAHVMYMGTPLRKALPSRARDLIWGHFNFAGVSNLKGSAWWESPLLLTSSRGFNHPLPLAESVLAAIFTFSRGFDIAVRQTDAQDYSTAAYRGLRLVSGKTLGIVGLGGIGSHLARLARGCGMRVVANRRSAGERRENVEGVDVLYPASGLHALLAESDFVAVCAMWTPETEGMLDRAAFRAMKPGAYLINVARGELVVEDALIEALESGRLAGAHLDVWHDSFNRPPTDRLLAAPNVIFTPHTSNIADSNQAFSLDLFCDNLARLLKGEPLVNVIDWKRGY